MLRLLEIGFKETRRPFAVGIVGIASGAFIIVFFLGLVAGIHSTVETQIFAEETLEVAGSSSEVLSTMNFLSGRRGSSGEIDEATLEQIGKIPGVGAVHPRLRFMFPAKAYGGKQLFGFEGGVDLVGDGIPTALLRDPALRKVFRDFSPEDSAAPCSRDKQCGGGECCVLEENNPKGACRHPVPFLVSKRLLEIYNTVIAPAHNLVTLPEWTIRKAAGMRLTLVAGRSYQGQAIRGTPVQMCLGFAGISPQAIDIGISVPLPYVERWNAKFSDAYTKGNASSAELVIARKQSLGSIIQRLKGIGIGVRSSGKEELGFFIGILNGIFVFISIVMLLVASLGIFHIFYGIVVERKREIGLMRALGASRRKIMGLFLFQAAILGVVGGAAGVILAVACSYAADFVAASYLPDFPFKPDTFFRFEPWIIGFALLLSFLTCIAGAWWPARKAARQNPMEVLD